MNGVLLPSRFLGVWCVDADHDHDVIGALQQLYYGVALRHFSSTPINVCVVSVGIDSYI